MKYITPYHIENLRSRFTNVKEEFLFDAYYPLQRDSLNPLLEHITKIGASDVHIEGYKHILVDVHGVLYPITPYEIDDNEAANLLKKLYDENAITRINGIDDVDTSYTMRTLSIENKKNEELRFRVNAIGTTVGGRSTIQVTIRTLPSVPMQIQPIKKNTNPILKPGFLSLEEELWENICPEYGLVLVTGPTGSGKSTLLAACIHSLIIQKDFNKKIVTYEAPIEFVYDKIDAPSSIISQTEVYTQIKSFAKGIESALRRKPNIILIGESRDPETIDSSILASQTGHLVYTTLHTNSASETIKRMINVFPVEERLSKLVDLINSVSIIISQRLLPTIDGKRCAVKEYLIFDNEVKKRLVDCDLTNISNTIDNIVKEKQQRLIDDVYLKFKEGLISEKTFRTQEKSFGKHTADLTTLLEVRSAYTLIEPREYQKIDDLNNLHIGLITDKMNRYFGKIVYADSNEIDEITFRKKHNISFYFYKEDEKISGRYIVEIFKKNIADQKEKK